MASRAKRAEPGVLVVVSGTGDKVLHLSLPIFWGYKVVAKVLKSMEDERNECQLELERLFSVRPVKIKSMSLSAYVRKYPINERAFSEETFLEPFLALGRRVISKCAKSKST